MLHTQFYSLISVCMYIHLSACMCKCVSASVCSCVRVRSFKCIGSFVLQSLLMQSLSPTAAGRRGLIPWGSIWGFLAPRWKISARKESRRPPRWTCGRIAAGYHCASRFSQISNSGICAYSERTKTGLFCIVASILKCKKNIKYYSVHDKDIQVTFTWGVSSSRESSSCQTRSPPSPLLTPRAPPQAPGRYDGARRSCDLRACPRNYTSPETF